MKPKFLLDEPLCASRRDLFRMAGVGSVGLAALAAGCSSEASPASEVDAASPATSSIAILSSNENPFGPSKLAVTAMKGELVNINRYSNDLTTAFGEKVAAMEGVSPDQVIVTNGSTPILALFAEWAAEQDGKLLTSAATYEAVPRVAERYGAEVIYTPLSADMGYDLDAMAARMGPDIATVYICNPNNPTGSYLSAADLRRLRDGLRGRRGQECHRLPDVLETIRHGRTAAGLCHCPCRSRHDHAPVRPSELGQPSGPCRRHGEP